MTLGICSIVRISVNGETPQCGVSIPIPPTQEDIVAVGTDTTPFLFIYNALTRELKTNPTTMPNGLVIDIAINPQGTQMAVANFGSPTLLIYDIINNEVVDALTQPTAFPVTGPRTVRFTNDGSLLAVGGNATGNDNLAIYDTSTYNLVQNPADFDTQQINGIAFNSLFCAMGGAESSARLRNYDINAIPWIELSGFNIQPTSQAQKGDFYADWFATATFANPRLAIYDITQTPWIRLTDPAGLPNSACNDAKFSPDGVYLAAVDQDAPSLYIYDTSTIPFTLITNPAILPGGPSNQVSWSQVNNILAVAAAEAPFILFYDTSVVPFVKLPDPIVLPSGAAQTVAFRDSTPPNPSSSTVTYFVGAAASDDPAYFTTPMTSPSLLEGWFIGFPNIVANPNQTVLNAILRVTEASNMSEAVIICSGNLPGETFSQYSGVSIPAANRTEATATAQFPPEVNPEIEINVTAIIQEILNDPEWLNLETIYMFIKSETFFSIFPFEAAPVGQSSLEITLLD